MEIQPRKDVKIMDKITHDINAHFGYDIEKTVDFFTLPREAFLHTYEDITDIEYNNTCVFWLNRIDYLKYIYKPIGLIEGIEIAKIYRKNKIEPLDLFIICS